MNAQTNAQQAQQKGTYTPGPWTAHDDDGTGTLPCVLADQVTSYGNFYVAQCNVFADARLIAAAPDLLEALENIEANLKGRDCFTERVADSLRRATAAIAKAKGAGQVQD